MPSFIEPYQVAHLANKRIIKEGKIAIQPIKSFDTKCLIIDLRIKPTVVLITSQSF